ncbi:Protein krasavietz [Armadillidium vulgare]|nr:Protein krasavietz [Armadillidium vulgare]
MTTKAEKPTLQGQRIKARKRDEKAKYDPVGFRDAILHGLAETSSDLEAVNKYLDSAGSKLDYRTYGEVLFDILIAGGILLPGGVISDDGVENGPVSTNVCVFGAPDESLATLKGYAQVFTRLMRRYKYLEKMFFEEMKKVLVYLKGFTEGNRSRLARCVAIWTSDSLLDPKVLIHLVQEHLIKDGLAVDFLCEIWSSIMASVEWNKKDELVADQALRHLRIYAPLFAASTTTARGELQLLLRVQEYCYDNMNFMKVFQKIVYLFYKSEVLSEDVIMKWYKDSHSAKGKSIFLVQMKKFIEWLQNAETDILKWGLLLSVKGLHKIQSWGHIVLNYKNYFALFESVKSGTGGGKMEVLDLAAKSEIRDEEEED